MQEFDKDSIKLPATMIITGKKNTGKSTYVKLLLYYLCDKADELYIFCPTYDDSSYKGITKNIYNNYDMDILNDIIERQKVNSHNDKPMKQVILLFDDCILEINKNDKKMQYLFMIARHFCISPILITQKFRAICDSCRTNADYIFCTKIYNILEREKLFEEYGSVQKLEFYKLLKEYTKNYGIFVIDNTLQESEDIYFHDKSIEFNVDFYI
jgi:hypothetical protein